MSVLIGFADYIANGLLSESFRLPEMCWRAPVHLNIFHVIILCETDSLFNKLYLQICYTDLLYRFYRYIVQIKTNPVLTIAFRNKIIWLL